MIAGRTPFASNRPALCRSMHRIQAQSSQDNAPQPKKKDSPSTSGAVPRRSLAILPPFLCCGMGPRPRNDTLDRMFATSMATGMADYEASIFSVKRRLFSDLRSRLQDITRGERRARVVELGCGTGPNIPFYDRDEVHIVAVDPNQYMLPYLKENMKKRGWKEKESLSWLEGTAEALPVESASADAVVCTLVLCSVADVRGAVAEAARVLRPGGVFLFIEHTAAQLQRRPLLRAGQTLMDPLQRLLADGCSLTRDPLSVIDKAGFRAVESRRFEVEGAGLIAPHVAGIATL
jgi:SAM-dependent methyltransferase